MTALIWQLRSSSSESILARWVSESSRSLYIRVRGPQCCCLSWRTRSAEKPSTPPTSTAPRRNINACCLERCILGSELASSHEIAERRVPLFLQHGAHRRLHGKRGRREHCLVRR